MRQADLFAPGRALRDAGMQTAVDHADAVHPTWSDRAFASLRAYVAGTRPGVTFTCEAVRDYAERRGVPPPPDNRAWGIVMSRGARAGLYRRHGYVPATHPQVHMTTVTAWVRT